MNSQLQATITGEHAQYSSTFAYFITREDYKRTAEHIGFEEDQEGEYEVEYEVEYWISNKLAANHITW